MKRPLPFHPLLLAVFPVLNLLAENLDGFRPGVATTPALAAAAGAAGLWALLALALRDVARGALAASLAVAMIFLHGHLRHLLGGGDAALLAAGAAAWTAVLVWLARRRPGLATATGALNAAALALVLLAGGRILLAERAGVDAAPPAPSATRVAGHAVAPSLGYLPDVYLVVLDALASRTIAREIYGVDLQPLADALADRGFEVVPDARANYSQTALSLSALLNRRPLQELLPDPPPRSLGRRSRDAFVQSNETFRILRRLGYELVTFDNGPELSLFTDADVILDGTVLDEFSAGLLATTPLPLLTRLVRGGGEADLDPYAAHRRGLEFQLGKLGRLGRDERPRLVFAHVLCPHPPFVFDADGAPVQPDRPFSTRETDAAEGYVDGYRGQLLWLADRLPATVDRILAESRRPPVIVLLGDHGPASRWLAYRAAAGDSRTDDPAVLAERMSTFVAILAPGEEGFRAYDGMSLVNVFRLVMSRCFGMDEPPLPDTGWFSSYEEPLRFVRLPAPQ